MPEKVRIISKNTGLGNQIQFIPLIRQLMKTHHVCSDSAVYDQLGINLDEDDGSHMLNMVVFGYNHKKLWKAKKQFKGKFFGFKYRIKGKHIGFGYNKSLRFNENIHEVDNILRLYNYLFNDNLCEFDYVIPGHKPESDTIVVSISPKEAKTLPDQTCLDLVERLKQKGYKLLEVDKEISESFVKTPTLADLKNVLSKAKYYIGTDSGVFHLADILGIPSLIMFGATSIEKNGPYNKRSYTISRNMTCSPCFDWGRIDCKINYACMKFEANEIIEKFEKLIEKNGK